MMSYLKQIDICDPVLKTIKRIISESNDIALRAKITDVPSKETVLRAVSAITNVNAEEELRAFTLEYALNDLHLSRIQTEQLRQEYSTSATE